MKTALVLLTIVIAALLTAVVLLLIYLRRPRNERATQLQQAASIRKYVYKYMTDEKGFGKTFDRPGVLAIRLLGGCTIKMREVSGNDEAFYEMRRYLEVNHIYSTGTFLYEDKRDGYLRIDMGGGVVFSFHTDTSPDADSLEDACEKYESLSIEREHISDPHPGENNAWLHHVYRSEECVYQGEAERSCAVDEYNCYMKDLQLRVFCNQLGRLLEKMEGGTCH